MGTKVVSALSAARMASSAQHIFLAGCTGEPSAILNAVAADPTIWQEKNLTGAFIPGVNDRDFSSLGKGTVVETIFATTGLLQGYLEGQVSHLPMHYSAFWKRLSRPDLIDCVIMTVPTPAEDGTIGFGLTADFATAPIAAGAQLIGIISPMMPDVRDGPRLPRERFTALVEDDTPLPTLISGEPDTKSLTIANYILDLLSPGDTLQLGLGKIPAAVLHHIAQSGLRRLGFHAGMISPGILAALDADVFSRGVTTGVALGDQDFYEEISRRENIQFASVGTTHSLSTLTQISRFISVNSVIEVDLLGQANCEHIGGRQISGHGGLVDFMRGSRASNGGRAILVLPATTSSGCVSRIIPLLTAGVPVSVARSDTDMIVTEYGIADLREASVDQRAERLIAVAAPQFRNLLANAWHKARCQIVGHQ